MYMEKDINFIYTISLIAVAVALLEYLLFVEPLEVGSNNMLWGYECAIYLGFVGAIAAYETIVDKYKLSKAMQATVQGIFAVHGIIGVYVFMTFPLRLWKIILN